MLNELYKIRNGKFKETPLKGQASDLNTINSYVNERLKGTGIEHVRGYKTLPDSLKKVLNYEKSRMISECRYRAQLVKATIEKIIDTTVETVRQNVLAEISV